MEQLSISTTV